MTPYELGETREREAVAHLRKFLEDGTANECRLAASAVNKLSKLYPDECKQFVDLLLVNTRHEGAQVRQYSLKALGNFTLPSDSLEGIREIAEDDEKEYNQQVATKLLEGDRVNSVADATPDSSSAAESEDEVPQGTLATEPTEIDAGEQDTQGAQRGPPPKEPLSPRDMEHSVRPTREHEQYTANYAHTAHNFVIQNNLGNRITKSPDIDFISVLKNILMRGCPTTMSLFLQDTLGAIHETSDYPQPQVLISRDPPVWIDTIKSSPTAGDNPALEFFEEILPEYLPEQQFIQQLMLPETKIEEITLEPDNRFVAETVDFYLPQALLAIEIDGRQHMERAARAYDVERDKHLRRYGVRTVRIRTDEVKNRTDELRAAMAEIAARLIEYKHALLPYRNALSACVLESESIHYKKMVPTAIIRFQILVLSLLEKGRLDLDAEEWRLSIVNHDVHGYVELALQDLFTWLENLCQLFKVDFQRPSVKLKEYHADHDQPEIEKDHLNIDFSLLKRWTDENELPEERNRIYVRTDYFDGRNYFKVSVSDPIDYQIIAEGEASDLPALKFFLNNIFGFPEFLAGQRSAIINSLAGRPTVGLLPTGGGKSLIYQYVGLLKPCIHFVVTPLISLMKDQRDHLDKVFINHTNFINSTQTAEQRTKVQKQFGYGKYHFVWVSPERFQTESFRDELQAIEQSQTIGLAVVDEVHCLSEWGHDFRTSYLNLASTIERFCPRARILALTATASYNVLKDIMVEFDIPKTDVKTLPSFTRSELEFRIHKDDGGQTEAKWEGLKTILSALGPEEGLPSGIVFTPHVNGPYGCYDLVAKIREELSIDARYYSGSVPKRLQEAEVEYMRYKEEVQDAFSENEFPLMVATKAFGMGINKQDLRYTVHYGIPSSVEALYQEAGRAGRDRRKAVCHVLFSEEHGAQEHLESIFRIDATVSEIKDMLKRLGHRDALRQLFLWSINARDVEDYLNNIARITSDYALPGGRVPIPGQSIDLSKEDLEKAIYQLSLAGIVEDWTVRRWNAHTPLLVVQFARYSLESIEQHVLQHIRKYEAGFDFREPGADIERGHAYHEIYKDDSLPLVWRLLKILLTWQYDNIAYHQRQSIRTVYDLCKNHGDNQEYFINFIESYFEFSDGVLALDFLVENPDEYEYWFTVFRSPEGSLLPRGELLDVSASLRRLTESYRYNTGLNFISGMVQVLTDQVDDDGIQRLDLAFSDIREYEQEDQDIILQMLLGLATDLPGSRWETIGESLVDQYPDRLHQIHDSLRVTSTLRHVLHDAVIRLRRVRGVFDG